jgi:ferredoxin
VRVQLDRDLCELHGQCAFVAPEVFTVNDDSVGYEVNPLVELLPKVRQAVKICPQLAIKLEE